MTGPSLGRILIGGVVLVLAASGGSIWASQRLAEQSTRDAVRQSEQKLCAIVVLSDDQYRETPPTTELGRKQAENFAQLRRDLGC